jgi:hypothetical protein
MKLQIIILLLDLNIFLLILPKNPQVTGKSYNLKGLLVHYSTIDIFQNMTNIDIVLKKLKIILYNIFSLFIYDDLKTFLLDIDLFFYIIKMLNIKLRKSF